MELPLLPADRFCETLRPACSADIARAYRHSCFVATDFAQRQPARFWKKTYSDKKTAIASQKRARSPSNRRKGDLRKLNPISTAYTDKTVLHDHGDIQGSCGDSGIQVSESVKHTSKPISRKATRNAAILSRDIASRELCCSPRDSSSRTQRVRSAALVSKARNSGNQVSSRKNHGKPNDYPEKKIENKNKALPSFKAVSSRNYSRTVTPDTQSPYTRGSQSDKASHSTIAQAQLQQKKSRKFIDSKGRKLIETSAVTKAESSGNKQVSPRTKPGNPSGCPDKSIENKGKDLQSCKSAAPTENYSTTVTAGLLSPPTKRWRASHSTLVQTQLEQGKKEKITDSKDRIAMLEANGLRVSKRAKKNPEEAQHVLKLNLCSKHGNLHGALEIYDAVKKGKLFDLKQHHYNVLLYICSGAASGSITRGKSGKDEKCLLADANKQMVRNLEESKDRDTKVETEAAAGHDAVFFGPEDRQLAAERGTEIYKDMIQAQVPPNEATFTSVARLAVAKGDGDLAFETVKKMAAANITPKLRTYGPALLCFCEKNQVDKAFEVDDHMLAAKVLADENILEALLKLCIGAGLEEKLYTLLQRLRTTVRAVSPATVLTMEQWFNSKAAAFAGKAKWDSPPTKGEVREAAEARGGGWHGLGWLGKGTWVTNRTNISKEGACLSCGETLCTIDLDPEETEAFAKSVSELAFLREHNSNEFVAFQDWLGKNGPFEAVVDGANIGMYNSQGRGFHFNQIATVANAVKARSLTGKSPLIILHRRRTSDGASRSPGSQNIIKNWKDDNVLYSTPHGSNDDWYWLYAAVNCKCLLVTNDEMRDHLFELLGDDFFPKWKERHQVRFTFSTNGLELFMPPPYTTVIQESQNGSWHIPQSGGNDIEAPREWLCVTRSNVDGQVQ